MTFSLARTPKIVCQITDELHYTLNTKDIQGAVQKGDCTTNTVISFNKKATFNIAFKCASIVEQKQTLKNGVRMNRCIYFWLRTIQGAVQKADYTTNTVVSFDKKATFNIAFKCASILKSKSKLPLNFAESFD